MPAPRSSSCPVSARRAGDNPDRLRSEAAFAHLCGAAPVPASSGRTNRRRLNRTTTARPATPSTPLS
ncbi:transposase [Streptomyces olivaceoviridis]|uniref:transposase n=1 Tax=Streptomyces olivaceoviridis TaxID=1921 RepID=UPI003694496C